MLDREKVGNAIAAQRKTKGMTQKHLADMLNVSYQAVSRWEQGLSLPSVDMIYDLAQVLETTVDALLNGPSVEKKKLTYEDTGLDTKRLYLTKQRLDELVTKNDMLLHTHYIDPVFFNPDTAGMEEPVYVFANHVPGSKERFAQDNGYDREICIDLASNAANNLIRFGVKPAILQAHIVCGNNDSGQILMMGEAFKEVCENNGIVFAGMEVAAQAVNYHPYEYRIGALVFGTIDKKNIITGSDITAGDLIIGLHTDGINGISYPFIKVMIDQKPEIIYAQIEKDCLFMDELMKPNAAYVNAVAKLIENKLVHGIFNIRNSLSKRRAYNTMPRGLSACISASAIQVPSLFRYLYHLNMMDDASFVQNFSLGIGMLVVVPENECDKAVKIIEQYHQCSVIGRIEKNDTYPDEKVWMEGSIKW